MVSPPPPEKTKKAKKDRAPPEKPWFEKNFEKQKDNPQCNGSEKSEKQKRRIVLVRHGHENLICPES